MRSIEEGVDLQMLATVPGLASRYVERPELGEDVPRLPEENILYFVEKHSPRLQPWQREVIRIVRTLAQQTAFPSVQTKVLNEGAAMFVEKYIFYKLYDKGLIDEGSMMEYARLNAGVLYQPELAEIEKERAKTKNPKPINLLGLHFNPYALGLAICEEIVRISGPRGDDAKFFEGWIKGGPTREDKQWFPWAGDGNWRERLRDAWANYRDDSFIEQFLSPSIMRRWKMFSLTDMGEEFAVTQTIHENAVETTGFEEIRSLLAQAHSFDAYFPQVAVIEADLLDERELVIQVTPHNGMELEDKSAEATLEHLETLWGYEVSMADPAE
jgi:stage V sporulation protein R